MLVMLSRRPEPQLCFVWFCKRLNPFNYKDLVKCNCSTAEWIWTHFCFPGWLSAFRPQIAAVTMGAWLLVLRFFSLLKREESYLRSSVTMSRGSNPERGTGEGVLTRACGFLSTSDLVTAALPHDMRIWRWIKKVAIGVSALSEPKSKK